MSQDKIDTSNTLELYLEDYEFSPTSRIRREGDVVWIPELFCHNGHSLMNHGVEFDGHRAVHIKVAPAGEDAFSDIYLSPIINDTRKQGPELPAAAVQVRCPVCDEELRKLVPCTCQEGAYRRAIYLDPDPERLAAVGVCEIYGCPQSFVTEEGELLYEVIVDRLRKNES